MDSCYCVEFGPQHQPHCHVSRKLRSLESQLSASQARVAELEREKAASEWHRGPRNENMLAFVRRAETAVRERDEARDLVERLRQEAQIHAQEARTQKATVHASYQAATGATGEPGDWHGADPIRQLRSERDEAVARAEAMRLRFGSIANDIEEIREAIEEELENEEHDLLSPLCQDLLPMCHDKLIRVRNDARSTRPDPARSDAGGEAPNR